MKQPIKKTITKNKIFRLELIRKFQVDDKLKNKITFRKFQKRFIQKYSNKIHFQSINQQTGYQYEDTSSTHFSVGLVYIFFD